MERIIVALVVLVAIVQGLAADLVPEGILPLALVVLGLVYAAMAIDAEDATPIWLSLLRSAPPPVRTF